MARVKKNRISVLNWMATLLVCAIPGVNIIAVICFLIFAKSASKKSFALALLIWMLIAAAAIIALLVALPDQAASLADWLRQVAAKPEPTISVIP